MECSWKLESFVRHVKLSSHLLVILGSIQPLITRSEESINIGHMLEVHRGLQEVVQNIKFHSLVPHLDLGRIGSLRVIGVGIKLHHQRLINVVLGQGGQHLIPLIRPNSVSRKASLPQIWRIRCY